MEKKISIIVAAYNVEDYLERCLESIKNQTYKNIQIIVIDDGSTDSTSEICDRYAKEDERFLIIHKENGGLSAARNTGLEVADGFYLAFVDGDDYIEETFCMDLERVSRQNDSDMVIFSYYRDYGDRKVPMSWDGGIKVLKTKEAIEKLIEDSRVKSMVWMKFYKRELFEGLYFKVNHNYEDVYIMHHVFFKAKKIVIYNKSLYNYLYREDSISNFQSEKNLTNRFESLLLRYNDIEKKYPDLKTILSEKAAYSFADIYNAFLASKHKDPHNIKDAIIRFYKINSKYISIKAKLILFIIRMARYLKLNKLLYLIIRKRMVN